MFKYILNAKTKFHPLYKANAHVWMKICVIVSLVLSAISLAILLFPPGLIYNWIESSCIRNIFSHLIAFLNKDHAKIIEITISLISFFGSSLLIWLNGKNAVITLPIKTMFQNKFMIIGFIGFIITILQCLFASIMQRSTSAAVAFFSLIVFILYFICYLIRFYNDKSYYRSEICNSILLFYDKENASKLKLLERCIKKSKIDGINSTDDLEKFLNSNCSNYSKISKINQEMLEKSKPSKFETYLSKYLWPDIITNHNDIKNDVLLLEYLILNVNIDFDFDFDFKSNIDNNTTIDENEPHIQFFKDLLVKIIARMRRTYIEKSDTFLLLFAKQISNIRLDNPSYDFILHSFILITLKEYFIESDNWKNGFNSNNNNLILQWLNNNDIIFKSIYGSINEDFTTTQEKILHSTIEDIYYLYINQLDNVSVININSYYLCELNYIKHHKILKNDYSPHINYKYKKIDIIF